MIERAGYMRFLGLVTGGLLGLALTTALVPAAFAQNLQVMKGTASTPLNVPMNRAVVVESDTAFAVPAR